MRIEKVVVSGFRSFGAEPVTLTLGQSFAALIGTNGTGKTAFLASLALMFGVTQKQRTAVRTDFHLPPGTALDDRSERQLFVDVFFSFPELLDGTATADSIAPSFSHMLLGAPNELPRCRMRLEATWQDDKTAEGSVDQALFWIQSLDINPVDTDKIAVKSVDRGLIQLYYAPATRDASVQIRSTTGALASRLIRAVEWADKTRAVVEEASNAMQHAFSEERSISSINDAISARWSDLNDQNTFAEPHLSLASRRFQDLLDKFQVIFNAGHDGNPSEIAALSDGQQSLFYFALIAAVFDVERNVIEKHIDGFRSDDLLAPALSIFALEEPENHLSPFYLSKIINQISDLTKGNAAQALITSHSPSILGRLNPESVRHFFYETASGTSTIRSLTLPSDDNLAAKYIRSAIVAFPEIYFAKLAILVEGDSERVVLPRLARALGIDLDPSFIAVVPLGGRHVQHFWRLLQDIKIPYLTLLDLDLGRHGAGFGRIKYVCEQLLKIGTDRDKLLAIEGGVLDDARLSTMHTWDNDYVSLQHWITHLRTFNVYFCQPLDLDMTMTASYPDTYSKLAPDVGLELDTSATNSVLGTSGAGPAAYSSKDLVRFSKFMGLYRRLFLTGSKPATHLAALAQLEDTQIRASLPEVLTALLNLTVETMNNGGGV
jgi:putative ATP-dependent endonuclease of the OLD family